MLLGSFLSKTRHFSFSLKIFLVVFHIARAQALVGHLYYLLVFLQHPLLW